MNGNTLSRPRAVLALVLAYVVVSFGAVAAVAILAAVRPELATPQAWYRSVIVAATSLLTLLFARGAVRGRPRGVLRLRIVLGVILLAIVGVLLFLPLPLWMILVQFALAAILLAALLLTFTPARSA